MGKTGVGWPVSDNASLTLSTFILITKLEDSNSF